MTTDTSRKHRASEARAPAEEAGEPAEGSAQRRLWAHGTQLLGRTRAQGVWTQVGAVSPPVQPPASWHQGPLLLA